MKLEEGMYVRYTRGMINGCVPIRIAMIVDCSDDILIKIDNGQCILREDVIKARHKIIDLIEVGDYVNGHEVIEVGIEEEGYRYVELDFDKNCDELHWGEYNSLQNVDIKSVVTKEQFNSVKYEVE